MTRGEVVGAIAVDKKPRRKLSLKDRVAQLDRKIEKAERRFLALKQQRATLVAEARAALAEIETEAAR
jgi:hypothetical protein